MKQSSTRQGLSFLLSPWQLGFLLVTLGASQESTVVNALLTPVAGRNLWIAILLGGALAAVGAWMWWDLLHLYPGYDLTAILRRTLGPLAWPAVVAYVGMLVIAAGIGLRAFTLISNIIFPGLPAAVFSIPLIGLALYGDLLGIQIVARVNGLLLLWIDIPAGLLLSLLFTGQQKLNRIFPILAHGWAPALNGAWLVFGFFGQMVVVLVFASFTRDFQQSRKATFAAILMVMGIALGHNLGPILMFGAGVAKELAWPTYNQLQMIEVGEYIQRLDVLGIFLWFHGFWLLTSVNLEAAGLCLARQANASSTRPFLWPLAAAIYIASALLSANESTLLAVAWTFFTMVSVVLGFGLPLLIWLPTRLHRALKSRAAPAAGPPPPTG